MAQTNLQKKLLDAFTRCAFPGTWSYFDKHIPLADKYNYPLRKVTTSRLIQFYFPLVKAASLFTTNCPSIFEYPFRMVLRNKQECILEAQLPDGTCIVIVSSKDKFRMNIVESDGTRTPAGKFSDMSESCLTMIALSLLRFIFEIDQNEADGSVYAAAVELAAGLSTCDPATWTSKTDISDRVLESAYFLDAAMEILKRKMVIDCGADTSTSPGEIDDSYFTGNQLSGELIVQYLGNSGWEPQFVTASGKAAVIGEVVITVGEAKKVYGDFSAHRNWTPEEKKLIYDFPDDMPVMPEALKIIKRLYFTRNSPYPMRTVRWRGPTSYGKTTGTQQVSCILNMPMLTQTCFSSMETQDFLSMTVPRSQTIGLSLSFPGAVSIFKRKPERPMPPKFEEAMAYLTSLDNAAREEALNPVAFFELASLDPDAAVEMLLGKGEHNMEFSEICVLFAEVSSAFREAPLNQKINELESEIKNMGQPVSKEPDFIHVPAPFLKAMVMGYIIEIQEASRVRDQGQLVGLNKYDHPGAKFDLSNGEEAFVHKDSIIIWTDNVGYDTCRNLDPSVIRRCDMCIDSSELTEDELWERVTRNTGVTDKALFKDCYKIWKAVQEYCAQNSITDGCVSATELTRYVQAVALDGRGTMMGYNLDDFVISKATSDMDNQREIRQACSVAIAA